MSAMKQEEVKAQLDKILRIFKTTDGEIRPHFMLTGPSGSGKSFTIGCLAEQHELNFIEVNAAQLTKEGLSGNSLSKALTPLLQAGGRMTVVFVDEFDKLFISGNNCELAHESTTGVQNEFLKVLESDNAQVFGDYGKYVTVPMDKVLFVFAGAFNGIENIDLDKLRDFGLKTEFIGRVGLIFNLAKPTLESMHKLLHTSKLLETYLKVFPKAEREDALDKIGAAIDESYEKNTLGVRLINTMLHKYFINGGKLTEKVVKESSFQKTLEFSSATH